MTRQPRTFTDRQGLPIGIAPEHVVHWAPGTTIAGTTVVALAGGHRLYLSVPFAEFHAWVIGPAAAADAERKEKGETKRKGK